MKNKVVINIIISLFYFISIFSMGYSQENKEVKKVIYETDMCLDVDDVGALAILHAMADMGEAEILAVCFNEEHPNGAGCIDAINTWYGHGDIPIGVYKENLVNDWSSNSSYLNYIDNNFPNDIDKASADSALTVYREILSQQPDSSVTIISVGFLNNLNDLLLAEPELIEQKVVELIIMAGINNDGFNLVMHNLVNVSENVLKNWPTPIVISQPGGDIYTGDNLSTAPIESPVRWAFYKWFNNSFEGRSSWDEIAVLYGVRGLSNYFNMGTSGSGSLSNGYSYPMQAGWRTYLIQNMSNYNLEQIIEDLMDILPQGIPVVEITSPENNASFDPGTDITIEANASDTDGSVAKVEFFANSTKIGEDTTDPYSIILEDAEEGIIQLTARVTDDENKTSLSDKVKIIVGEIDGFLVGHWTFEDNAVDASDYGHDGIISGSPEFVTGKIGKALKFDSNQEFVTIPSSSDFSNTSFTISAWVKIPNSITSGWQTIIEHNRWGGNWFGLWKSDNGNKFHFRWGDDGSTDFNTNISANRWYHVAATFDADQEIAKVYLDGELDKTLQSSDVPDLEIGELVIGRNYDGEEAFKGIIDDLRIYNMALDESEINDLLTVTSINDHKGFRNESQPKKYSLSNYPNPFNPSTTIHYSLPIHSHVKIDILDINGRIVSNLVNTNKQAGDYNIRFEADNISSGVYLYRICTQEYKKTNKMIFQK